MGKVLTIDAGTEKDPTSLALAVLEKVKELQERYKYSSARITVSKPPAIKGSNVRAVVTVTNWLHTKNATVTTIAITGTLSQPKAEDDAGEE